MNEEHWVIYVTRWGTFFGIGTEEQAENWRKHKANYEQSVATKRKATDEEIKYRSFNPL